MSITARIVVHELERKYGQTYLDPATAKCQFEDVRLLSSGHLDEGLLYVADTRQLDVTSLPSEQRRSVLAVGSEGGEGAGIRIVYDIPLLEVFTFLQDTFMRYRHWLQRIDRSILRNEGLQKLFDLSEEFLVNNVTVVNPALKLLARTRSISCDDPVTIELIKHGCHTEQNIKKFQLNQRFKPWAEQNGFIIDNVKTHCRYTTAAFSFKAAESFSLVVVMVCNNVAPEPWLLDTFVMFLTRVAYYSLYDYGGGSPSGSAFDAFMHDILNKSLANEDEIEERRRYLGIPAHGPFCLFAVDIGEEQYLAQRIVIDIARNVTPAKAMIHGSTIVVLCFSCCDECSPEKCKGVCPPSNRGISDRLEKTLADYDMKAGRSSAFMSLTLIPIALDQALCALKAGIVFKSIHGSTKELPTKRIFAFDAYYLEYLVLQIARNKHKLLTTLPSCRVLARLREYDRERNTDNYRFLRYYLRYERRATVVAEKLHMHRNNVKYRANRLQELFDIDTENERARFELTLAYRILDTLER